MLWVSADPGCGKSVLAKYLIDEVLPSSPSRTVCYFFFKDDFDDQKSAKGALCCMLHQLFTKRDVLFSKQILAEFESDHENLTGSFLELWDLLVKAARDENAGEVVCVLDAFDECDDEGKADLTRGLRKLYTAATTCNLKVLLTSRPYMKIKKTFQPLINLDLPVIHLSGESQEEMDKISKEIDIFVEYKVEEIGSIHNLLEIEKQLLLEKLMGVKNRTYLWVYLILSLVESDGIVETTNDLPDSLDKAYNRILQRSSDPDQARKILHIVVAAARPLTLSEINFALELKRSSCSYHEVPLQVEQVFQENLRDLCGLFVTVVDRRIYLLHQTAKEFLVPDGQPFPQSLEWKHAFQTQQSHFVLAEICMWHLLFDEFQENGISESTPEAFYDQQARSDVFLDYSAKHWVSHLHGSHMDVGSLIEPLSSLCDITSKRCLNWLEIYWTTTHSKFPQGLTSLMVASYFGLTQVAAYFLSVKGVDLKAVDNTYQRSALSWASENGFPATVELLIRGGNTLFKRLLMLQWKAQLDVDSVDVFGRTPLLYAAWKGHAAVVKLLLSTGRVDVNQRDEIGATPLYYAILWGHDAVVKLLRSDANVESEEAISKALLLSAAKKGHDDIVQWLLELGKVDVNCRHDDNGETPLWLAASGGHKTVVKQLLETNKIDINLPDHDQRTPLLQAVQRKQDDVVDLLLATGAADVNKRDNTGQTPLILAVKNKSERIVQQLLASGIVDLKIREKGWTALWWAAWQGEDSIFRRLLEAELVDINEQDDQGRTLLGLAAFHGHNVIVEILLGLEAVDVSIEDHKGRTPLWCAMDQGHSEIFQRLLPMGGVNLNAKDKQGLTLLSLAARSGNADNVQFLLDTGEVDTDVKDDEGYTALWLAAITGHTQAFRTLLHWDGIDVNVKDARGRTLVRWALESRSHTILQLLRAEDRVVFEERDKQEYANLASERRWPR